MRSSARGAVAGVFEGAEVGGRLLEPEEASGVEETGRPFGVATGESCDEERAIVAAVLRCP